MLCRRVALVFFVFVLLQGQFLSTAVADTCKNFYEALVKLDTGTYPSEKVNNLGIYWDYKWDQKDKKKKIKRDKNNFPLIRLSLFHPNELATGTILKTINNKDLSNTNDDDLWDLVENSKSAKIEFFDENKINEITASSKEYKAVYFVLQNYLLNSINDIEAKEGFFSIDHTTRFEMERVDFKEEGKFLTSDDCPGDEEVYKKKFYEPLSQITLVQFSKDQDKITTRDGYSYDDGKTWQSYTIEGVAKIRSKFDFSKFPFDKQKLHIEYNNHDLVMQNFEEDTLFLINPNTKVFENLDYYKDSNYLQEWKVKNAHVFSEYEISPNNFFFDTLTLVLEVERNSNYYIYKIILPVLLILGVAWCVLWIPTDEIESRLTTSIVALLSLIAYNFVFQDAIPKLDILTSLDKFILLSYTFCTIPIFTTIFLSRFVERKRKLASIRNRRIRIFGGAIYVFVTITIFYPTL